MLLFAVSSFFGQSSASGTNYALFIGVDDYEEEYIPDLNGQPTERIEALYQVLTNSYNFGANNSTMLKNPSLLDISDALGKLKQNVTDKDQVLIVFSGHSNYNQQEKYGYWMPADAHPKFGANIYRNTQLQEAVRQINSKHTLIISDAVFSGNILVSNRSLEKSDVVKSRMVLCNGSLGEYSATDVFLKYITKRLENNKLDNLSASRLFMSIEVPIINNSVDIPRFGAIADTGHRGGYFIFTKN